MTEGPEGEPEKEPSSVIKLSSLSSLRMSGWNVLKARRRLTLKSWKTEGNWKKHHFITAWTLRYEKFEG